MKLERADSIRSSSVRITAQLCERTELGKNSETKSGLENEEK